MDYQEIHNLFKIAQSKMNENKYNDVYKIAKNILNFGENWYTAYVASGLLIDVGFYLNRKSITDKGIKILNQYIDEIKLHPEILPAVYYNLGTGYDTLYKFEKKSNLLTGLFENTLTNKAKCYYRRALECINRNHEIYPLIATNYGNCLDQIGRSCEALEYYDKAIKVNPNHSLALGNKGIAIKHYSWLVGEHQTTFLLESKELLVRAIKNEEISYVKDKFNEHLDEIANHLDDVNIENLDFPGVDIRAKSQKEKKLIQFCLKYGLYLNICSFCNKCNAAIGDTAHIRHMIVKIKNNTDYKDPYLPLASCLNEIKQSFITSRFLIFLSNYGNYNMEYVDKRVRIIDTLDYCEHNVYQELLRISFERLFNLLDKISGMINVYLDLNIPENKISIFNVWFDKKHKGNKIRQRILATENYSLNAIYDIQCEFSNKPLNELKKIRNALTHRFLKIKMIRDTDSDFEFTHEDFFEKTLNLAKIVRNVIIYLLQFFNTEEDKKYSKSEKPVVPFYASDLPNNLKGGKKGKFGE